MDILCTLWNAPTRGRRSLSVFGWAGEIGKPIDEVTDVISDLMAQRVCSFKKEENGDITIVSRRMVRDEKMRKDARLRQRTYREQVGGLSRSMSRRCHGDISEVRSHISESESEEKKEKSPVGLAPNGTPLSFTSQAEEVLGFLNEKSGRKYRAREGSGRVSANLEQIIARLKSGATVEQCRAVIAIKCREWKHDEKMQKFLRPATLFSRTNFEQYVGEVGT